MTILLVRHAHAGSRSDWEGLDVDRPLSDKGRHQTDALTARLADRRLDRLLSSSAVRCLQTLEPAARARGLEVEVHPALSEGAAPAATTTLIWQLASEGVHAALSSHGDVVPAVLDALAAEGIDVGPGRALPKGTYYELAVVDGVVTGAHLVDPRP